VDEEVQVLRVPRRHTGGLLAAEPLHDGSAEVTANLSIERGGPGLVGALDGLAGEGAWVNLRLCRHHALLPVVGGCFGGTYPTHPMGRSQTEIAEVRLAGC